MLVGGVLTNGWRGGRSRQRQPTAGGERSRGHGGREHKNPAAARLTSSSGGARLPAAQATFDPDQRERARWAETNGSLWAPAAERGTGGAAATHLTGRSVRTR